MHMADALISPAVGGAMWIAAGGFVAVSAKRIRATRDDHLVPLMGVSAAFVFAAQMINFTIPATGSSGHLGGGLLLAVLLGPHAAFLAMASILTVQALFFADGGILALGANIVNMGVFSCFVAYPLVFRSIAGKKPSSKRLFGASLAAAVLGLQIGAFGVVIETTLSGMTELPFKTFVMLMQPIHLAISVVEGLATSAVVLFVQRSRPELFDRDLYGAVPVGRGLRLVIGVLAIATVLAGGALAWFASTQPDGLEWSIARTSGKENPEAPGSSLHAMMSRLQDKTSFLPGYSFGSPDTDPAWPAVDAGTSLSGMVGSGLTLLIAVSVALLLRRRRPGMP